VKKRNKKKNDVYFGGVQCDFDDVFSEYPDLKKEYDELSQGKQFDVCVGMGDFNSRGDRTNVKKKADLLKTQIDKAINPPVPSFVPKIPNSSTEKQQSLPETPVSSKEQNNQDISTSVNKISEFDKIQKPSAPPLPETTTQLSDQETTTPLTETPLSDPVNKPPLPETTTPLPETPLPDPVNNLPLPNADEIKQYPSVVNDAKLVPDIPTGTVIDVNNSNKNNNNALDAAVTPLVDYIVEKVESKMNIGSPNQLTNAAAIAETVAAANKFADPFSTNNLSPATNTPPKTNTLPETNKLPETNTPTDTEQNANQSSNPIIKQMVEKVVALSKTALNKLDNLLKKNEQ
jgi:hypothetical protein